MRKKILLGVVAAVLVAQNVAVFATALLPPVPDPQPIGNGCYQTVAQCRDAGGGYYYMAACSEMKTSEQCKKFICSSCWLHQKPVIDLRDWSDPLSR